MRLHLRIKLHNLTVFGMLSSTQRLFGITNKIGKDKYFILWDIENCTLDECLKSLGRIQLRHHLGEIFITSDKERSFHAWCYNIVSFRKFLSIICDTKYCDWNFIRWSVARGQATIRTSQKKNRPKQRLVATIWGKHNPIVQNPLRVIYDTGIDKRGKVFTFG